MVRGTELIDTLWNVNYFLSWIPFCIKNELIDTLWNVNFLHCLIHPRYYRINRYIMECKSQFLHVKKCEFLELIDTLWNVNIFVNLTNTCQCPELIDTLWNVN